MGHSSFRDISLALCLTSSWLQTAGVKLVIAVDPAQLHPLALDRGNIHHLCMKAEDAVPEVDRLLHGRMVGHIRGWR